MKDDRAVIAAVLASLVSLLLVHSAWAQPFSPVRWLPHRYIGTVTASYVHDGDTFTAEIANDFGVVIYGRIRLAGLSAPEVFGTEKAAGVAARDYLAGLLVGHPVYLEVLTTRTGKPMRSFERTLARAWIERDGELVDVTGLMVKAGHGVAVGTREIAQ